MPYPSISSALQAHRNYAVQKFTDDTDTEIDNNTSTHTHRDILRLKRETHNDNIQYP